MRIIWVLGVFLLFCVNSVPVMACSPTATPSNYIAPVLTLEDYTHNAPVIFVGTIVQEIEGVTWGKRYEVHVEHYLKGSGFNIVYLDGYGYLGLDCLPMINEGAQRIFFARENGNNTGIALYGLIVDYPLEEAEAVSAITGQSNPAQALPLELQLTRIAEKGDLNWLYIPLSILLVFMGIIAFWLWRRGRRKTKAKREII